MKVVLLAAGRSKRLKPIEDKNFLKFLGKPLLLHQVEQLSVFFDDFIVIGGAHNLGKIRELLGGWKVNKTGEKAKSTGPKFQFVEQKNLDEGMAGALLSAEPFIKKEPILVVSANDVVESQAYKLVLEAINSAGGADGQTKNSNAEFARKTRSHISNPSGHLPQSFLIGKKVESYFPGGYLKTAKDGSIQGIVEKPGAGNEPSDMINLVIHYHKNSEALLKALHSVSSTKDDRYEVAMDHLIKAGHKMKAVPYNGFWQSIKYPWHVLSLMEYFLGTMDKYVSGKSNKSGTRSARGKNAHFVRKGKNVEIASSAIIKGSVFLDDFVKVFDNAVISGPAYIGKNSIVATNALVRGSMTGENCIVGFSTEIARSYLGDMVWTHSNYIGDSVIGNDVSFGAGTVTGNLRLDEGNIKVNITDEKIDSGRNKFGLIIGNNVRCGINTSFMPGVKIGNNSMIGAGIIVAQDVSDNKLVYGKTELIMKENKANLDQSKREAMKKALTTPRKEKNSFI